MTESEVFFNPFEPGFTDDPYPAYRRLRELEPVQEHPLGFWMLSAYDDVVAILRAGLSVEPRYLSGGFIREQFDQLEQAGTPRLMSMLDRDPPDHTRLRSLVSKVFTPRKIAALEPLITELVDTALDRLQDERHADLVSALAFPLPFEVISRMLGMPAADHARIRDLGGRIVRALEPIAAPEMIEQVAAAEAEMSGIVEEVIAWKRVNLSDDLLSALITAESDGDRLSDEELVAQVILLYVAGHETTVNLIGGGSLALLRNRSQLDLLRSRPELAADAVEEFLRYEPSVQLSRRITTAPYKVRDREIPAGTFVIASLASANRDESVFGPDAEELRIDRPEARNHTSFGAGHHYCLGASLARLEGRIAIERLVNRFPDLSLDGEVEWNGRINLRGPERLPVSVAR